MPNWAVIGIVLFCMFGVAITGLGTAAAMTALENFFKTFE